MSNNETNRVTAAQQMLTDLFKSSKVQSINPTAFDELHQFRKQLDTQELGPFHQPYENQKQQAITYRYLFLGISLIFILLMGFVHFRTASWICNLFFAHFVVAKTTLSVFCGALASISLFIAFRIRTEREAALIVYRHAKRKLSQVYVRKCAEFGVGPITAYLLYPSKTKLIRYAYHDSLDKMQDMKDSAISLLSCIAQAEVPGDQQIKLFNQTIIELREELNQTNQRFRG